MHIVDDEQRSDRRATPMRPSGSGLEGASASLVLLDDVHRHRLRRAALHLPLPSQERGPFQFSDRLLGCLLLHCNSRCFLFSFCILADEIGCPKKGFKSPRIRPPAVQNVILHSPLLYIAVVHVRDLQFPSPGRLQSLDNLENRCIIHINSCHGELRGRMRRLFIDPNDLFAPDFGHAEPLGIRDLLQQYSRSGPLLLEVLHISGD